MNALVRAPLAALILAAAPAATGAAPGPVQEGAEALLPDDAILYMGSADLDAFIAESKSKAMGKILTEEEVQDFLEKPLGMAQQYIDMGLAMARSQEPGLEGLDPKKMLTGPYGISFMAFTHLGLPESPDGDPDVGLVVGLEAKEGALDVFSMMLDMAQTLAKEQGVDVQTEERMVGEHSYVLTRFDSEGPPLCFAKIRGTSVMSLSETSLKGMLERAGGAATSLKASASFAKAAAEVGGGKRGSPLMYVHTGRMMAVLDEGLSVASKFAAEGEEADGIAMAKKALAASGFLEAGVTMISSAWDGDVAVSKTYSETNPQTTGLMAALESISGPVDTKLIELIPKEALSFSLYNMQLAPLYDGAMGLLKQVSPEFHGMAAMQIQQLEGQVGGVDADGNPLWNIRRDLIAAVGGPGMSMTTPGAASMFGPANDSVYFIGCADPAGLQKSLDYLIKLPGEMAGFPVTFQEEVWQPTVEEGAEPGPGVTMKVLDPSSLGPAAMLASMIQPTYAIAHGRMYAASSPKALEGLFNNMQTPPTENVTAKEDFKRHFGALPQDATLMTLSYADTASNFEGMYNAMLGIVPMAMLNLPISQEDLPIEMSLLPTAEAISKHLFGSAAWTYKSGPGAYVAENRGPFGAEMTALSLLAVAAGGGAFALLSGGAIGEELAPMVEAVPSSTDPIDIAYQDLRDISAAITVYSVEFGSPPAQLGELVKPKPAYPNGVLPRDGLPTDPWGNGYSYLTDGLGGYLLWSHGPNGADEKGGGDDLKIDRR